MNFYLFSPFYGLVPDVSVSCGEPDYPETGAAAAITAFAESPVVSGGRTIAVAAHRADPQVGVVSFLVNDGAIDSRFVISLGAEDLGHDAFGTVAEGFASLQTINGAAVGDDGRFLADFRITTCHVLEDPWPEAPVVEARSFPSDVQLRHARLELSDEHPDNQSNTDALALELMGDLPHYSIQPSPQTLFVAKLNPLTTSDSLEIIFSRFGEVRRCQIVDRDGKSACYGFVEFGSTAAAEAAYAALHDGCVIDGKSVVVDFSQSVRRR